MTMIELVAALALFVVIFGILLLALNAATNLWDNSRAQRRELPAAEHIADLIADDLYQAVADPILPTNGVTISTSFAFQNLPTNTPPSSPVVILAFPRIASPRTLDPDADQTTRLGLDSVFYTLYNNALYRIAFPLHTTPNRDKSLGELFENGIGIAENTATIESDPPTVSVTPLAEHVVPTFIVHYPDASYGDDLETNALPSAVDLSLHLFDAADWGTFQSIVNDSSDAAALKRSHLGTLISRRVTLPQAGGSRLP
jgi:type II secretory pathway component PulJ